MTSTPFASSTVPMTDGGATLSIQLPLPDNVVVHATQLDTSTPLEIQADTTTLLTRVQRYADTGKVDVEGLCATDAAALVHILRRLHATFVKQIDCDEILCDASRKCPKCGASRVPSSPEKTPGRASNGQSSSPMSPTAASFRLNSSSPPPDVDMT
ncbi:hypothetical protein B5M09_000370 [Aphanomyces astaci]|uniref:Uncharacterized protein n=1 Tax=Aphanomyces astaci TaxID=112090 RepID=A0A3R7Y7A7_APHAT|nr:hypothetical protein B5M09_000370 [Aphanomyces astaci]